MQLSSKVSMLCDDGMSREIDLSGVNFDANGEQLTDIQSEIVKKLMQRGNFSSLTTSELDQVRDVRALIGSGTVPDIAAAVLVRFDMTWVSIK